MGASLHDVLTRLKAQPQLYPTIDISHSPSDPLGAPVILNLSPNGFRLRFDGPDQRLRLVEVLDFTKTQISYKDVELVKLPDARVEHLPSSPTGPAFRHVYNKLMGPTFPGEYIPPEPSSRESKGLYILSYPGVAFTFPLQDSAWSPNIDFVSLLSSNAASGVVSMAIFDGQSWQESRQGLMTRPTQHPRSLALSSRGKEYRPDEVELVRIRGNGDLVMERRCTSDFQILLNRTTPQDLVAELGPPDAIHRKFDRRLSIHKNPHRRPKARRTFSGDTTDTDQSSTHTTTDDSDMEDQSQASHATNADLSGECFYNYFHHGFDIFISYPTSPSPALGFARVSTNEITNEGCTNQLVATKVLLHANVPGSYPFNRYRRSRWVIDLQDGEHDNTLTSESCFSTLSESLQRVWRNGFANGSSKESARKAMVLNRDWVDSPGSSCEILGNWEDGPDSQNKGVAGSSANIGPAFGNTKLYGFPGLLFEVLNNDAVSCLTIY